PDVLTARVFCPFWSGVKPPAGELSTRNCEIVVESIKRSGVTIFGTPHRLLRDDYWVIRFVPGGRGSNIRRAGFATPRCHASVDSTHFLTSRISSSACPWVPCALSWVFNSCGPGAHSYGLAGIYSAAAVAQSCSKASGTLPSAVKTTH